MRRLKNLSSNSSAFKKMKIMTSSLITSWQIEGEKVEVVTDFLFLGSKITLNGDCSHEIKRHLLLGRKSMTNLDSISASGTLIDRVPDELWTEVCDIIQETGIKTIPMEKKCKKAKWLSEKALQIAVKRREVKSKGEKERYTHLNAEFQRIARRDKKAFLSDQCKEIEENNRMGKTRDLFKKIRDTKRTFHAKMGTIKDRNVMDLTEADDIKKRWQEYTEGLYKKDLHDPDSHNGMITRSHLEPDILECEV